ncbi:toprim domain-containing protein [Martelella sp. FLE1502]
MSRLECVTDLAKGRWTSILLDLGIDRTFLTKKHGPCPFCGGKDRFRYTDIGGTGGWICNQCGHGSGIDWVMRAMSVDFKGAADMVRPLVESATPETVQEIPEWKKREWMNQLWKDSRPVVQGDPVWLWFNRRVGGFNIPKTIRYCERCEYKFGGVHEYHPAMVAMIHGPDGKPCSLHRTYLTKDGRKASVSNVRMMMPSNMADGAAIRLCEPGEAMGLAEGIETAASFMKLFNVPTWAVMNATMLEKWEPPEIVKRVFIGGDNDQNFRGQKATFTLANRLALRGIEVVPAIPGYSIDRKFEGHDWNNELEAGSMTA